jgi:hypothetical protein
MTLKIRIFIAETQSIIMKTNNFKVEYKSTQLISILSQSLAGKMNIARVKFFGLFICSICQGHRVSFCQLATAF